MAATKRGQCCHEHVVGDTKYYCVEPFGHQCAHSYRPSMHEVERLAKRIADLERELAASRAALLAIKRDPYGCPFCDSGKLRKPNDPNKGHNDDCGYLLLDAALKETP